MAQDVKNENDLKSEIDSLKSQLEEVTSQRDEYRAAYVKLVEQNTNLWGVFSNTVDYVVTSTQRKQSNQ